MNIILSFLADVSGEGMPALLLIGIIVALAIGAWAAKKHMDPGFFQTLILVVLCVLALILVLQKFGVWEAIKNL